MKTSSLACKWWRARAEQPPTGRIRGGYAAGGFLALVALAACSAPDASELFSPVKLATRSGSGGNGGASDTTPPLAEGGSSSEGQGGSDLGFGGTSGGSGGADVGSGGSGVAGTDAGESDAGLSPDAEPPPCEPEDEVCDGLDNDCDGDVDPGATCAPTCAGFALDDHGYMSCSQEVTHDQALALCEAEGMRLVWLETPEESESVREQIIAAGVTAPGGNPDLLTQIGGSDAEDESEWRWVGNEVAPDGFQFWNGEDDGEAVDDAYVDWADGEPSSQANEDCAALNVLGGATQDPGQWDDRSCNDQLPFLCEIP